MMKKLMKCVCALALVVGVVGLWGSAARAEDLPPVRIQISPVRVEYRLEPGRVQEGTIRVSNTGAEGFEFTVSAVPHTIIDSAYLERSEEPTPRTEIARWVVFDQTSFFLDSGESILVPFRIEVPVNAPGGGQFAMIMVETSGNQQNGHIASTKRLGMVVHSRVSGETVEVAELVSAHIPRFHLRAPVTATSKVENQGNVDVMVGYRMHVRSLLGRTVFANYCTDDVQDGCSANGQELLIFPEPSETRRIVELKWEGAPVLGIFRVTQEIEVLGQVHSETRTVFVVPLFMLILLAVIVVGLIVWVVSKRNKMQRSDKRKKAREKKSKD